MLWQVWDRNSTFDKNVDVEQYISERDAWIQCLTILDRDVVSNSLYIFALDLMWIISWTPIMTQQFLLKWNPAQLRDEPIRIRMVQILLALFVYMLSKDMDCSNLILKREWNF